MLGMAYLPAPQPRFNYVGIILGSVMNIIISHRL